MLAEEDKPIEVIPDKKYKGMYRLRWADGSISVRSTDPKPWEKGGHYGFYNLSHATNILNNYDLIVKNMSKRHRSIDGR